MPRLVSLTLLSMLALPAGAIVYFVTSVLTWEVMGWRARHAPWIVANLTTAAIVVGWWVLVWRSAVSWSGHRVAQTVVAGVLSAAGGTVLGLLVGAATREYEIAHFVGGVSTIAGWLTAVSLLWRQTPLERAHGGASAGGLDVRCLRCGYSMHGLREARCPECGELYTLDALFAGQAGAARTDLDRD